MHLDPDLDLHLDNPVFVGLPHKMSQVAKWLSRTISVKSGNKNLYDLQIW